MVVFTCNNCGDSVNKPKVDKHVQYECKRKHFTVSLCCVDCLKDFNYETSKDHCQCVTEEQRYSAKGFVPKASSEKGKRKQSGWVDIVQSLMDTKDLSNDERQFLNVIGKYDNVPRKKNKFQNFCFSSAPAYRKKGYLIDKVFDMIEAKYKAEVAQNSKPVTNNIPNNDHSENVEKNVLIQEEPQEIVEKKKCVGNDEETKIENVDGVNGVEEAPKKKKKKNKQSLNSINDDINNKSGEDVEVLSEKKKKKKEKNLLKNNIISENDSKLKDTTNNADSHLDSAKKSKKTKKKSEVKEINHISENSVSKTDKINKDNDLTNGENGIVEKPETQMTKKKKKEMKKKLKYQHELATVNSGIVEMDKEPISKKKKRKLNDNEENEEPQQKILKTENISKIPEIQPGRKFDWNEAINQVLQSKKNKPISQSKVMKRVMNEYYSLNETIKKTESELEKIFLKKLRKMKNVVIDNDKVKLVEC